jgi:hypothetical protein
MNHLVSVFNNFSCLPVSVLRNCFWAMQSYVNRNCERQTF